MNTYTIFVNSTRVCLQKSVLTYKELILLSGEDVNKDYNVFYTWKNKNSGIIRKSDMDKGSTVQLEDNIRFNIVEV